MSPLKFYSKSSSFVACKGILFEQGVRQLLSLLGSQMLNSSSLPLKHKERRPRFCFDFVFKTKAFKQRFPEKRAQLEPDAPLRCLPSQQTSLAVDWHNEWCLEVQPPWPGSQALTPTTAVVGCREDASWRKGKEGECPISG